MSWFERAVELLGSREWLLLMLIVIVAAAFAFPENRLSKNDKEDRDKQG